jgi:nitroreductase
MDFLLARRSVRIFKDKPVPVEVLQKIIDAIATAPFGVNPQNVDAHIYLTYSLLAAHSLGLGASAIGLIGPAINQSKPLRRLFRIPEGNEVVESMIAGYPKFPFKRAIVRPRTKVAFIS